MRKDLFSKKQLVSDRLPPTEPELTEHIKRANYQSYVWQNATKPLLELPSPKGNGWSRSEDGDLVPTKMLILRHWRVLLSLQHVNARLDARTKDVLVRKMTFSVVMLAFSEDVKKRYS